MAVVKSYTTADSQAAARSLGRFKKSDTGDQANLLVVFLHVRGRFPAPPRREPPLSRSASLECGAFLAQPSNFCLGLSQCLCVTSANCRPDISSKRGTQSGGQNTNGYENCSVHVVYSNLTFEYAPLIKNRIPFPA
jgi:hypothetical protein